MPGARYPVQPAPEALEAPAPPRMMTADDMRQVFADLIAKSRARAASRQQPVQPVPVDVMPLKRLSPKGES